MGKLHRTKHRRLCCFLLAALLAVCMAFPAAFALDDDAYDGYAADDLTIEVGYFGGPFYTKRVFTLEELQAMPLVQEDYTFIDNMPSVVIDHAVGVRLDDLMQEAGIDLNSIETFYFWTRDKTEDYYTSYSKTELLDTTRYCYYSLPENFDSEEWVGREGADAIAVPVPTILAIADDWNRCIKGAEFGSDYLNLSEATRFRLIFGQVDVSTRTANRSAKWIHKIVVQLGGAPTITVDAQDLEDLEVGSVRRVSVQVHAADSAIAQGASVTWSSSDESVAVVDQQGNVTVVGEGSAVITASYGGASRSFTVNGSSGTEDSVPQDDPPQTEPVSDNPAEAAAPASPPDGGAASDTGTGGRNSSGTSGKGSGSGNAGTEKRTQETGNTAQPDRKVKLQSITLNGTDSSVPAAGNLPEEVIPESNGGVQNWRVYEMSEAAKELENIEMDNPLLGLTGAASCGVFAVGGIVEYVLYRRRFGK